MFMMQLVLLTITWILNLHTDLIMKITLLISHFSFSWEFYNKKK